MDLILRKVYYIGIIILLGPSGLASEWGRNNKQTSIKLVSLIVLNFPLLKRGSEGAEPIEARRAEEYYSILTIVLYYIILDGNLRFPSIGIGNQIKSNRIDFNR